MKAKLFLLVFSIISLLGYAMNNPVLSADTTQYVTNTNTEKLIDKYSGQVFDRLSELADKLQVPAGRIYEKLTIHNQILGIATILAFIICFSIFLSMFITLKKSRISFRNKKVDLNVVSANEVILGISSVVSIAALAATLWFGIEAAFNPEYYAIKDIFNFLAGK